MALSKQAKILGRAQTETVLTFLTTTRYPERNAVVFLLSTKAGLRAKEIAALTWEMVTDAEGLIGDAIHLPNQATKGSSGRVIPMNRRLRRALQILRGLSRGSYSPYVIGTERSPRASAQAVVNMFGHWYEAIGFNGCSSHSGRRTFITNAARRIPSVGGSLRDVQILAGHSNLRTTQSYIDSDAEAQARVVDLV